MTWWEWTLLSLAVWVTLSVPVSFLAAARLRRQAPPESLPNDRKDRS